MIGGAACIDGRVDCESDSVLLNGQTKPSFGVGATLGVRPLRWLMVGALYRWGMFNARYEVEDSSAFKWSGQHTAAVFARPILPIWRLDLGLNVGLGYSRQVFRREQGSDRDYSQGFAVLLGPTADIFVTKRLFLGAEVDVIFNTQSRVCQQRGSQTTCLENLEERSPAPTHQLLFGFHIGRTFL